VWLLGWAGAARLLVAPRAREIVEAPYGIAAVTERGLHTYRALQDGLGPPRPSEHAGR
jgi:hypothetical protein